MRMSPNMLFEAGHLWFVFCRVTRGKLWNLTDSVSTVFPEAQSEAVSSKYLRKVKLSPFSLCMWEPCMYLCGVGGLFGQTVVFKPSSGLFAAVMDVSGPPPSTPPAYVEVSRFPLPLSFSCATHHSIRLWFAAKKTACSCLFFLFFFLWGLGPVARLGPQPKLPPRAGFYWKQS